MRKKKLYSIFINSGFSIFVDIRLPSLFKIRKNFVLEKSAKNFKIKFKQRGVKKNVQ